MDGKPYNRADVHFNLGHAIRSLSRFREFGDINDLLKARACIDEHIKHLQSDLSTISVDNSVHK